MEPRSAPKSPKTLPVFTLILLGFSAPLRGARPEATTWNHTEEEEEEELRGRDSEDREASDRNCGLAWFDGSVKTPLLFRRLCRLVELAAAELPGAAAPHLASEGCVFEECQLACYGPGQLGPA